nr:hypothetical protein [Rhizobium sp. M1]
MRSFRDRLRHEKVIEGIPMMERKLSEFDQMFIGDIEPVEPLTRQHLKNLVYVCIELADPRLHCDFLEHVAFYRIRDSLDG